MNACAFCLRLLWLVRWAADRNVSPLQSQSVKLGRAVVSSCRGGRTWPSRALGALVTIDVGEAATAGMRWERGRPSETDAASGGGEPAVFVGLGCACISISKFSAPAWRGRDGQQPGYATR